MTPDGAAEPSTYRPSACLASALAWKAVHQTSSDLMLVTKVQATASPKQFSVSDIEPRRWCFLNSA